MTFPTIPAAIGVAGLGFAAILGSIVVIIGSMMTKKEPSAVHTGHALEHPAHPTRRPIGAWGPRQDVLARARPRTR